MEMQGDADRGFERLLSRLDGATRLRYCAQALDEDLCDALAQFQQCAQAMDHARQVDDATRSLIANASTAVHLGSATTTQHLRDLTQLHRALGKAFRSLSRSVESAERELPAVVVEEKEEEKDETKSEETEEIKLLERTRSILTKQLPSLWLTDAVELARRAVRLMVQKADEEESSKGDKIDFSPADLRIYQVFKLLRKCVLKEAATHAELLPVMKKMLRRLGKKRPLFAGFVAKSEELLAAKETKIATKTAEETVANTTSAPAQAKSKKRRLTESTMTAAEDVKIKIQPEEEGISRATLDVRSKLQLCSVKTSALRDDFSRTAFDVCLKMMIEVVNAITPQLTREDTVMLSSTLVTLVNRAMTIDVAEPRMDRLRSLEGLLGLALRVERLEWSSSHAKTAVLECRTKTRSLLGLSAEVADANGVSSKVPGKRKKKEKPSGMHMRFDGDK